MAGTGAHTLSKLLPEAPAPAGLMEGPALLKGVENLVAGHCLLLHRLHRLLTLP